MVTVVVHTKNDLLKLFMNMIEIIKYTDTLRQKLTIKFADKKNHRYLVLKSFIFLIPLICIQFIKSQYLNFVEHVLGLNSIAVFLCGPYNFDI